MRICFITQNLSQFSNAAGQVAGGAEKQMQLLAKGLSKYGIETTFIVSGCEKNGIIESEFGTLHLIKRQKPSKIRWIPALKYWLKLTKEMKRTKADVFYVRSSSATLFFVALWSRLKDKKVIYSASCDLDCRAESPTCTKGIHSFLYKLGLKMCNSVLAQHEGQLKEFNRRLKINAEVVENCIDTSPEDIDDNIDIKEKNIILYLGRIDYLKRPDVFIEAIRRLPQYSFVLAGGWPEEEKDGYVKSVLEKARKCKNLSLPGNVSRNEVRSILQRTALLINTSDAEGFPNTFLEAWSQGVPVVSLNVDPGGIMEKYNLVPATKSFEKFIQTIERLMSDPQERLRLGRLSKKCADENHSVKKITEKFLSATGCNV